MNKSKVTPAVYKLVKEKLSKGWKQTRVAKYIHLSRATICEIKASKTRKGYLTKKIKAVSVVPKIDKRDYEVLEALKTIIRFIKSV